MVNSFLVFFPSSICGGRTPVSIMETYGFGCLALSGWLFSHGQLCTCGILKSWNVIISLRHRRSWKKWACRNTWASWHCRFYNERAWHAFTFKITNLSLQKTQHENGPLGVFHTSTFGVILLNMGQDAQDGTKDYFWRTMMGRFSWKYHGPFFQTFCISSTPAHFYIYGCRRPQLLHQVPKHRRLWSFIVKKCCEFPSNNFWSMANIYFG